MQAPKPDPTELWRLSEQHQDSLLFPLDVHALHEAGQRLEARPAPLTPFATQLQLGLPVVAGLCVVAYFLGSWLAS